MINWGRGEYLWLLAACPLIVGLLLFERRLVARRLSLLIGAKSSDLLANTRKVSIVSFVMRLCVALLLILAIAQPRWGIDKVLRKTTGTDIMLVIDVSRSMDVQDLNPSRLEFAKRMIKDLVAVAKGDRLGIVLFAGTSFVQCPLTSDKSAILMFADLISTEILPSQGTDLGGSLLRALDSLKSSGESLDKGSHIVVVSDGEDHVNRLNEAINEAKTLGVEVTAFAVGTESGGPIPESGGGLKKDNHGQVVISNVKTRIMSRLAEQTNGSFHLVDDFKSPGLADWYTDLLNRRQVKETNNRSEEDIVYKERYSLPLTLALILMMIEASLFGFSGVVSRMPLWLKALLIAVPLMIFSTQLKAEEGLQNLSKGIEAQNAGEVEKAVDFYNQAAQDDDPAIRAKGFGQLARIEEEKKNLEKAIEFAKKSVESNASDYQAQMYLRKLTKDQQKQDQQKQDQQKQDQQKQDQQKQDQQKQDQQKQDQQKQDQQKQDQQKQDQQKQDQQKQDQQKQDQQKQDQQKQDQQKQDQQKQDQQKQDQQKQEKKEHEVRNAERILRMVPDDIGKFYRPPMMKEPADAKAQDW